MAKKKKQAKVWGPCSEEQRLVLTAQEDVILCGGGAGSGKSMSCLMKNLDVVDDPYARVVVCRKSRPEITRPGGLANESQNIYKEFGGVFNRTELKWVFPAGGEIQFLGVNKDNLGSLQGMAASRLIIDEAGDDWEEETVLFLLSRTRSASAKHKSQCLMSCNPNESSFLKSWISYCLDEETGVPKPGTKDIVRWFVVLDGKVMWGDSAKDCFELHGKKRGMVFGVGMPDDEMLKVPADKLFLPKSFRFIPSNIYSNPYLLPPRNMTYLSNLLAQSKKNQLKFLHGSWKNIDVGQSHFRSEWCELIDPQDVPDGAQRVRGYDLAATPVSEINRNPDFTCGVLQARDRYGFYYVEDMIEYRERPHTVLTNIIKQSELDGKHVKIIIPKDTGSGGAIAAQHFISVLSEAGCIVGTEIMSGHSNKLNKGLPFCQLAEAGKVKVVRGEWNKRYFEVMEAFLGTPETLRKIHDDTWDANATAFKYLAKQSAMPDFVLPEMTRESPLVTSR